MVWGVERTVPLASGAGKRGAEAGRDTLAFFRRLFAGAADVVAPARWPTSATR